MHTFPETIELRDGAQVVLRPMVTEDAQALHAYFSGLSEGTRRYLRDDVTDPDVVQRWAKDLDYDRVLPLLAWHKESVIGDATLHFHAQKWQRHLCEIRATVAEDYRGQRLGTAMVHGLLRIAVDRGIEKCFVRVMASEKGALSIFHRLGFDIECVMKDFAVDAEDVRQNVIVLCRNIEDLWEHLQEMMYDMDIPKL